LVSNKDGFMYVCLCNGYRDSDLRALASRGIASAVEAYEALGNGPSCGRCLDFAQEIIDGTNGALTERSEGPDATTPDEGGSSAKPAAL